MSRQLKVKRVAYIKGPELTGTPETGITENPFVPVNVQLCALGKVGVNREDDPLCTRGGFAESVIPCPEDGDGDGELLPQEFASTTKDF